MIFKIRLFISVVRLTYDECTKIRTEFVHDAKGNTVISLLHRIALLHLPSYRTLNSHHRASTDGNKSTSLTIANVRIRVCTMCTSLNSRACILSCVDVRLRRRCCSSIFRDSLSVTYLTDIRDKRILLCIKKKYIYIFFEKYTHIYKD